MVLRGSLARSPCAIVLWLGRCLGECLGVSVHVLVEGDRCQWGGRGEEKGEGVREGEWEGQGRRVAKRGGMERGEGGTREREQGRKGSEVKKIERGDRGWETGKGERAVEEGYNIA